MKDTRKKKRKENKKNPQIIFVTLIFVALFIYMSAYIVDYSIKNKQELLSNSYNSRQKILAAKNIRGTIYSKDGEVIVSSSVNEDGNEVRTYAYGSLFSHAVGYAINGRMGVEKDANYYLINSNAPVSEKAQHDAKGEKYPGDSVYTTLDINLQKVASDAMGVYSGAVIVTEPSTGKILAMVSKPDFDPASIAVKWDDYLADKESGVLVNRVTQGLYPPGSTFKIITALSYIQQNPGGYKNYKYNCTGSYKKGDEKINCYHGTVHGSVDFDLSFAKSCNSSFANIGQSLDRDEFGKQLNNLLYNTELPTPLDATQCNLIVDKNTDDADMIQVSIGQGKACISPLLLNMITCAISNNGVLMEPYIIDCVKNSIGNNVKVFKPVEYGNLMTFDEAQYMTDIMEGVVLNGTGSKLKGMPYYAGGKTGSAEVGNDRGDTHAWFTGFARMEDSEGNKKPPDICVTVIVEKAGVGGDYAVPIAKRIFDAYYGL